MPTPRASRLDGCVFNLPRDRPDFLTETNFLIHYSRQSLAYRPDIYGPIV